MNTKCEISTGRGLSCKDAIGGIQAIYFFNHGTTVFTLDPADDSIAAIAAVGGGPATAYKYLLKGTGNNLTQNVNSDRNTGTTFFEQVINASLKKMDATTNKEVKLMAYGNPQVVVWDNQGKAWLAGRLYGSDLTGGTIVTGDAFGDLNGYTLVFTANEKTPANYIQGSDLNDSDPFASIGNVNVISSEAATYDLSAVVSWTETGTFTAGTALDGTQYVEFDANVSVIGAYDIDTDTVNGYRFEGTGMFTETGAQTVRLYGVGEPQVAQTDSFTIVGNDLGGSGSGAGDITVA